ncbi:MerR family transcriptional regulator [Nitriliruptor alkaliphilus]|uniref:MerR family transcriptional regulator n=1 Tax=Nitriliruptor alkaliphilus TaxID=427918 RepID=UPI0006962510|nr:MerR family transcriptional regulator [Nitriliruptor alkaliphilus]
MAKRMTIDELAQATGVSSRNIRYYQTRGLLPPPEVSGRLGYYDRRHIDRLSLIQELQAEGLNLQAIGWLLSGGATVDTGELRKMKRALLDQWVVEQPVELPVEQALQGYEGADPDGAEAQRAADLGLFEATEDPEKVRVRMPSVLEAGRELSEMGASIGRQLDVLEQMRTHAMAVAQIYVELFDDVVLADWDARGRPAEEWQRVREALERIRPLAGDALLAVFHQVMAQAVADRVEEAARPDEAAPPA